MHRAYDDCQYGVWGRQSSKLKFKWRFSSGKDYAVAKCQHDEQVIGGSCSAFPTAAIDVAGIDPALNAFVCGDYGDSGTVYVGALCLSLP